MLLGVSSLLGSDRSEQLEFDAAAPVVNSELIAAMRTWGTEGPSTYAFIGTWNTRQSEADRVRVVVVDGEVVQITGLWLGSQRPADPSAATAEALLTSNLAGAEIESLILDTATGFPIELRTTVGVEFGPWISTTDFQAEFGESPSLAVSRSDGYLAEELASQRDRWTQRRPNDYDFDIRWMSSGVAEASGSVAGGTVTRSSDPNLEARFPATVDQLFTWVGEAMTRYEHIVVVFDEEFGHPRQVWLDRRGADDEVTITYNVR